MILNVNLVVNPKKMKINRRLKEATAAVSAATDLLKGKVGKAAEELLQALPENKRGGDYYKESKSAASNMRFEQSGGVRVPAATAHTTRLKAPKLRNNNEGTSVTISHREYIGPVAGNTTFGLLYSQAINPANAILFPWLSNMTLNYENYHFNKLSFHVVPSCATTRAGTVGLLVDYDPEDVARPPTYMARFMNNWKAASTEVWNPRGLTLQTKVPAMRVYTTNKYIRHETGTPVDLQRYDSGLFYCAVGDSDSTNLIGQLWVEYEIVLMYPVATSPNVAEVNFLELKITNNLDITHWLGTAASTRVVTGALPHTITEGAPPSLNILMPGHYFFIANEHTLTSTNTGVPVYAGQATGAHSTSTAGSTVDFSGSPYFDTNTLSNFVEITTNVTGSEVVYSQMTVGSFTITTPPGALTLTFRVIFTNPSYMRILIMRIPDSIVITKPLTEYGRLEKLESFVRNMDRYIKLPETPEEKKQGQLALAAISDKNLVTIREEEYEDVHSERKSPEFLKRRPYSAK